MKQEEYKKLVKDKTENSPLAKDCIFAFLIGGAICLLGQFINSFYTGMLHLDKDPAAAFTSITLIGLSALLTGIGLYDKLAKYGGAGTLVPITGFSNSVASPAIEFKKEGLILGMAPKMFIIAGPVIVYGTVASAIYGIIYLIIQNFF